MRRANPKDAWYDVTEGESPESLVIPYEDIHEKQKKISGESFPIAHWNCAIIVDGRAPVLMREGRSKIVLCVAISYPKYQ